MKRIILFNLVAIFLSSYSLVAQNVEIPDTAFLYRLIKEGVDTDKDSLISYAEAESVVCLDVSGKIDSCYAATPVCCSTPVSAGNIHSLSGIEEFINLDTLSCSGNLQVAQTLSPMV